MDVTNPSAVESLFKQYAAGRTAIAAHLSRLRALAADCDIVVELGVKRGASSTAFLLGARERVISYDIAPTPQAKSLQFLAGPKWDYRVQDSRTAAPTVCDLLFIDSLHTFAQVDAELTRHADAARRYCVFHDTITFGSIGAVGETGQWSWQLSPGQAPPVSALGIRPAIDRLMMRDSSWRIMTHYFDSHGLLVLART